MVDGAAQGVLHLAERWVLQRRRVEVVHVDVGDPFAEGLELGGDQVGVVVGVDQGLQACRRTADVEDAGGDGRVVGDGAGVALADRRHTLAQVVDPRRQPIGVGRLRADIAPHVKLHRRSAAASGVGGHRPPRPGVWVVEAHVRAQHPHGGGGASAAAARSSEGRCPSHSSIPSIGSAAIRSNHAARSTDGERSARIVPQRLGSMATVPRSTSPSRTVSITTISRPDDGSERPGRTRARRR